MNTYDIDQFIAAQNVPSVVALATTPSEIIYEGAAGVTRVGDGVPVTVDTPHAIMSMTKPIASMAVMRLAELGEVDLDAPATTYVPRYENMAVLDQVDLANKTFTTRPLASPFTVRQLLNHTAGFAYAFCNETLFAFGRDGEKADFPFTHNPGEQWTYGISTRVLGEVISAVTGQALEDALRTLVLAPLGMDRTTFALQEDQVIPHTQVDETWTPIDQFPYMPLADAGLISSARDYARFVQCLLKGGAPVLSSKSFHEMTSNQIGDLCIRQMPAANKNWTHPFPRGGGVDKFGLGFQLHNETAPGMRSPGSFSWCGLLNTYFWADPVKQVGGVVMMQTLPLFQPVCLDTLDGFERLVYDSLG